MKRIQPLILISVVWFTACAGSNYYKYVEVAGEKPATIFYDKFPQETGLRIVEIGDNLAPPSSVKGKSFLLSPGKHGLTVEHKPQGYTAYKVRFGIKAEPGRKYTVKSKLIEEDKNNGKEIGIFELILEDGDGKLVRKVIKTILKN